MERPKVRKDVQTERSSKSPRGSKNRQRSGREETEAGQDECEGKPRGIRRAEKGRVGAQSS